MIRSISAISPPAPMQRLPVSRMRQGRGALSQERQRRHASIALLGKYAASAFVASAAAGGGTAITTRSSRIKPAHNADSLGRSSLRCRTRGAWRRTATIANRTYRHGHGPRRFRKLSVRRMADVEPTTTLLGASRASRSSGGRVARQVTSGKAHEGPSNHLLLAHIGDSARSQLQRAEDSTSARGGCSDIL